MTFLTKAGSALVPISNKAVTIGLKMANLAGKCYSKASSTFFIPPWIWTMLIWTPCSKDLMFNLDNSTTAYLEAEMASLNSLTFL